MQKSNMCKILAVGIIVLFIGVAVTPCIIGKEIPRLRIYNTCIEKSETNPNNGSLSGYVNDTFMNPIQGARVRVSFHGTFRQNYTDNSGYYHVTDIPICNCSKNCTASKEGFTTEEVWLSIYKNTTYDFILNTANHPPNAPDICGPIQFRVGEYVPFTFNAVDPNGDNVSYYIEWGDGTSDGWTSYQPSGTDKTFVHMWEEIPIYMRAKAKDYPYEAESNWTYKYFRGRSRNLADNSEDDCGCNEVSKSDLVKVERLLNRIEVYSKLLLVLARYNPEVLEDYEELSNMISTLKTLGLKDLICDLLWNIHLYCVNKYNFYNDELVAYLYEIGGLILVEIYVLTIQKPICGFWYEFATGIGAWIYTLRCESS